MFQSHPWAARLFGIVFLVGSFAAPGWAAIDDVAFQERLRQLEEELRCLVCQNQSLADSHADLAGDLRREIREMAEKGKTNKEIVAFLTERYGDFVTYRPPLKSTTLFLWFGPLLFFIIAVSALIIFVRRRGRAQGAQDLTDEQRMRAEALLGIKEDRP